MSFCSVVPPSSQGLLESDQIDPIYENSIENVPTKQFKIEPPEEKTFNIPEQLDLLSDKGNILFYFGLKSVNKYNF